MATEKPLSTQAYLARWEELDSEKKPWLIHYQALAEIFLTRKMDFTRVIIPGQFLQADVFDNTGQFAAYLFASVCLSMLWPDSSRTFTLEPVRRLRGLPGVEEYFRWATEEVHEAMDQPRAGLSMALLEHLLDTGIFGTSALATFEGDDDDPTVPVVYDSWSIKGMMIAETAQGYVDTVYYKRQLTVRQIMIEYTKPGDKIPPKIAELAGNKKWDEKMDILHVIEPQKPAKGKLGRNAMRCRTVHIASQFGFRLRTGGYEEMPIAVGRLFKSVDEALGRSCGMLALPDAQSLNALTEAVLVATEKQLDPPLVLLDSGRLGGGVVDTSASALNVYDTGGRLGNEKPIQPLFTVGEMQSALEQQKELKNKIMQAFFLDRLIDLNNETQMTAYETSVRDKMRGEALGGIFARQEKEVMTPTVHRTFNIMFRKGHLGIINEGPGAENRRKWAKVTGGDKMIVPQVILDAHKEGLDVFEVKYISPAKRFQQAEKLQGLMSAIDALVAVAPVIPGITDNIDGDKTAHDIYKFNGAPMTGLRTKDDVLKFRAANRAEADKQAQLVQGEQASNIALKSAQARQALGTTPAIAPVASRG